MFRQTAINVSTMQEMELVPALHPPPFAQQHAFSVDRFYVMTPEGVVTIGHASPVELFRQLLEKYGTESKALQDWLRVHTSTEVCVQALIVICGEKHGDLNLKVSY